jgi:hypothetical protein
MLVHKVFQTGKVVTSYGLYLGLVDEKYPEDQGDHQTSDEHFEDKED